MAVNGYSGIFLSRFSGHSEKQYDVDLRMGSEKGQYVTQFDND